MSLSEMEKTVGGADLKGEVLKTGFEHNESKIYIGHLRANVE